MEISSKTKKSTYFFTCTVGHLNTLFVPAVGHLQVCFQKMLMPRGRPGGWGGGMGTAENDMHNRYLKACDLIMGICGGGGILSRGGLATFHLNDAVV